MPLMIWVPAHLGHLRINGDPGFARTRIFSILPHLLPTLGTFQHSGFSSRQFKEGNGCGWTIPGLQLYWVTAYPK